MWHSALVTTEKTPYQRATLSKAKIIYSCVFTLTLSAFFLPNEKVLGQSQSNAFPTPQQRREEFERNRTLDKLQEQTDDVGQRMLAPSDPAVVNDRLNAEVNDLRAQHMRMLNDMSRARSYTPDSDSGIMIITPRYSASELAQKQQDFDREEQQYLTDRRAEERRKLRYAQGQAADLQAETDNLAKQLRDTNPNRSFRLSPVGTNLYVHNFETVGSDPQDENPVAQTAVPARPRYTPAPTSHSAPPATQMPAASLPWAQLPATAAPSNKAIIPPGWNPLEEPGRKQALQAAKVRQNSHSNSTTAPKSNVKGKSVH